MQSPFILSIIAPTGCGKTYNTCALLRGLKDDTFPLCHRFNSENHDHGEPNKFDACHYIGLIDSDSYDRDHNASVETIITSGKRRGEIMTLRQLGALYQLQQQEDLNSGANYTGIIKSVKPANLIPNYIRLLCQAKKFNNICIVLDDMAHIVDDLSQQAQAELKGVFRVDSHHRGLSLIFLFQAVPKGNVTRALLQSSHYILFPIPPLGFSGSQLDARDRENKTGGTGGGVQVEQFRAVLHSTSGFSKKPLEEFEALIATEPRPNFIIYNKTRFMTDHQLKDAK
jgi:hypothetical protein